jgi:Tfp pilus assembly protein PilO
MIRSIFLALLVAILVGGLGYFLQLALHKRAVEEPKQELRELKEKVAEAQAAEASIPELSQQMQRLGEEVYDFFRFLPAPSSEQDLRRRISYFAKDNALELQDMTLAPTSNTYNGYREYSLNITVRGGGDPNPFLSFVERLDMEYRIVIVDDLAIQAAESSGLAGVLQADIEARTFFFQESATAE